MRFVSPFLFCLLFSLSALAQTYKYTVDANNIITTLDPTGGIGFGTMHPNFCVVRAEDSASLLSGSWCWLAGKDQFGTIRTLNPDWDQTEYELIVGPYSEYFDSKPESEKILAYAPFQRVWKITQNEIDEHILHFNDADYEMPEAILNWPGNGDTVKGFAKILAPFVDFNQNEIYEPALGDHPVIKGDVAVFAIYNDRGTGELTDYNPEMDIEVHVMLYAFYDDVNSLLGNTFFANYSIVNRGFYDYSDFYIGLFSSVDLGYWADDYVGSDSTLNLFYVYNGDDFDEGIESMSGFYPGFGSKLPAFGCMSLNESLHAYMFRNGDVPSPTAYPILPLHIWYCMDGKFRDGTQMIEYGSGYGGPEDGPSTNFMWHDDPRNPEGWSEVTENNLPYNRSHWASTGPFNFHPGEKRCAEFAYIFAPGEENAERFSEITKLKNFAAQLKALYPFMYDDACISYKTDSLEEEIVTYPDKFEIYPNPSSGSIEFYAGQNPESDIVVELYDLTGKLIEMYNFSNTSGNLHTIELPPLANQMYILRFNLDGHEFSRKIIVN